jgi:hypothetical protein
MKHDVSEEQNGIYMITWDAKIGDHHTITYDVAAFEDSSIMMSITVIPTDFE